MTPHPLEAARLLGQNAAEVQADRLGAAQTLAERYCCVVVLKGSGTVIAAPGLIAHINPSGNASLASAGTGDVLAGWLGGLWAQQASPAGHDGALQVACSAVHSHGAAADAAGRPVMLADDLISALYFPSPPGRG
jgi:NAD(P)H-hydrate repair Nnr-like enzyme with NAD(P)H-hydrate dehydratase domain